MASRAVGLPRPGSGLPDGSDFNYDLHVSLDENITAVEYNYMSKADLEKKMPFIRSGRDAHGVSVSCATMTASSAPTRRTPRGVDPLIGTYAYLDLTPLGRQKLVVEFPYHDSYDAGT